MPISWHYTDVYRVIIQYITDHLDSTNYLLNFGIIALHGLRPKVIIRFIRNNLRKSWTQLLEGETLELNVPKVTFFFVSTVINGLLNWFHFFSGN